MSRREENDVCRWPIQSAGKHQNKSYDYETITNTDKNQKKNIMKVREESVEAI